MPTGRSPARRIAAIRPRSEILTRRHGDHVHLALPVGTRGVSDDLPIEDRLIERHRDLLLSLEQDRRPQFLLVVDCG